MVAASSVLRYNIAYFVYGDSMANMTVNLDDPERGTFELVAELGFKADGVESMLILEGDVVGKIC